ncbi:hypothetical protein [Xenorhabdus szentirmaii]|uniref:Uncharacterized protein n=1 Tax=Xenorhabdus szentirmaii DSM 16338 TaxID=1427518 RepID=W1IRK9_9GAMM|nr:hypothetical protein [Xenorhabdus szentirmaii]PHM30594.1 hypothetical protein Xsze_04185 [Xenorhabdus szentirmaii DSM 16338]CDL81069.1 hypothetical protein XSR1_100112 [Xenorhabdus szentirmaii DSM 16338]
MVTVANNVNSVRVGHSIMLTEDEFAEVVTEFSDAMKTVFSSENLIIHSIIVGKTAYSIADNGSVRVLSRIS